jgi:NAD(P)-dependent dehydrogenase (short-subunit alcohol dehydrogenase family)
MPTAFVIGARNLGFAVIGRLLDDGWAVAGGARSEETLAKVRTAGADALEIDVTDQASVLRALREVAGRDGRVKLVVNAASPYGGSGSGPFGGGPLAEAGPTGFEDWAAMPVRGAFAFLSASARFLLDQGGEATVVQVTGGSARRGMPGRGPWAAGAFGVRALTQAGQSARAMTHELQVTPALDTWVP